MKGQMQSKKQSGLFMVNVTWHININNFNLLSPEWRAKSHLFKTPSFVCV